MNGNKPVSCCPSVRGVVVVRDCANRRARLCRANATKPANANRITVLYSTGTKYSTYNSSGTLRNDDQTSILFALLTGIT